GVTFRENLGTSGEGGGDPSAPLLHPGVRPTSQPLPGWGNCGYTAGGDVRGAAASRTGPHSLALALALAPARGGWVVGDLPPPVLPRQHLPQHGVRDEEHVGG